MPPACPEWRGEGRDACEELVLMTCHSEEPACRRQAMRRGICFPCTSGHALSQRRVPFTLTEEGLAPLLHPQTARCILATDSK